MTATLIHFPKRADISTLVAVVTALERAKVEQPMLEQDADFCSLLRLKRAQLTRRLG